MNKISIIIPALNEAAHISACLTTLQAFRQRGHEVIVVDGGSEDATVAVAAPLADRVVVVARGRARQLNAGARAASHNLLVFLHADTLLPHDAELLLRELMPDKMLWGRFDVRLSGPHLLLRVIEYFMNLRSRLSGIATGDQAIFVTRRLFGMAGGFPEIALMEDISFSGKLKKICAPVCLREKVVTSSRRWEERGIVKTVFNMYALRLRYAFGASPERLARDYE